MFVDFREEGREKREERGRAREKEDGREKVRRGERGREREKETLFCEKHQSVASHTCTIQGLNTQPSAIWHHTPTN